MTFDPTSVEVTSVTLTKDQCVQVPWEYINVCGYNDQFCKIPHTKYIQTTYYIHTTYRISDRIVPFWTQFRRHKNVVNCWVLSKLPFQMKLCEKNLFGVSSTFPYTHKIATAHPSDMRKDLYLELCYVIQIFVSIHKIPLMTHLRSDNKKSLDLTLEIGIVITKCARPEMVVLCDNSNCVICLLNKHAPFKISLTMVLL